MCWVWELKPIVVGLPVTVYANGGFGYAYYITSIENDHIVLQRIHANPNNKMRENISMKYYKFCNKYMAEDPRIKDTYHSTLRFPVMTGLAYETGIGTIKIGV